MNSYIQYKRFRGTLLKHSIRNQQNKQDDELNKSSYQDSYINQIINQVEKTPSKSTQEFPFSPLPPPLFLLQKKIQKNNTFHENNNSEINDKHSNSITIRNNKKAQNSAVHDYIEMKKRQQILEIYQNESSILDSVKQKMKNQPQKIMIGQNQSSFQNCYVESQQNNQLVRKSIHTYNNKSMNKTNNFQFTKQDNLIEQKNSISILFQQKNKNINQQSKNENEDQINCNHPLSQNNEKSNELKIINDIKCFRSLHKSIQNPQTIQSQADNSINQLQEDKVSQDNKSDKLFNNSALTQITSNKNNLYTIHNNITNPTKNIQNFDENHSIPNNNSFFFEKRQFLIPSLQKQNSSDNLFDLRSTQIIKEQSSQILYQSSQLRQQDSQLKVSEMYGNNTFHHHNHQSNETNNNEPRNSHRNEKRHLRSYSQRDQINNSKKIAFSNQSATRYNSEKYNNDETLNEQNSQISLRSNTEQMRYLTYPEKQRKQTISKLITYFNTIADFKQDSREQIIKNQYHSHKFLLSENKNDFYNSEFEQPSILSQSLNKLSTPRNEENNYLKKQNPYIQMTNPKRNNQTINKILDLSPLMTDISMETDEYINKQKSSQNESHSIFISKTSSTITSRTASPIIRPKYFLPYNQEEETLERSNTVNSRVSQKNIINSNIYVKSRKLVNSALVASKDISKELKQNENQSAIFMNKSFLSNKKSQKNKFKSNLINQSIQIDLPKKIQQKKEQSKLKLIPIDYKSNNRSSLHPQITTNNFNNYIQKNFKTIH